MRLLVDANLSPRIVQTLREHGHEAVHVIDVDLATATDAEIVAHADEEGFVIVTADSDFPMLVALRRTASPSIVLLRQVAELPPNEHARLLIANLPAITNDLQRGAIVSLTPDRLRIRDLPLG